MGRTIALIKKPAIRVFNAYSKWKRERTWRKQTKYWRRILEPKVTKKLDITSSYLILAPHADDEWIGCSQIIKQCEHSVILNMDMPGGDTTELHQERFKELSLLANKFDKRLITIGENKVESLSEIIDEIKPDYICLPHFFDWHPEHIQVMQYLRESLSQIPYHGEILLYQVSVPLHPDHVNCLESVNKIEFIKKWKIFEELYKTQTGISYHRFMANEKINGVFSNAYSAEVYTIIDVNSWLNCIDHLLLSSNEIDEVKASLSDISITRNNVMKYQRARILLGGLR